MLLLLNADGWCGSSGRLKLAALQKKDGALKLSHFRRVKQLGSGDVGLVDLVQVQGDPESRYAMKTLEKREMLERNKVLSASLILLRLQPAASNRPLPSATFIFQRTSWCHMLAVHELQTPLQYLPPTFLPCHLWLGVP